MGIFTHTAISPSLTLRQRSSCYAIRAGRNLPDKEFRYHRTVIVTAGVHQGLDSGREPLLVTFWHWPGISPYTSAYAFAETCVFGKQSPGMLRCGPSCEGRPLFQSYGAHLPSSLTRVLPNALVYSTHLPVSVCSTVSIKVLLWSFSRPPSVPVRLLRRAHFPPVNLSAKLSSGPVFW